MIKKHAYRKTCQIIKNNHPKQSQIIDNLYFEKLFLNKHLKQNLISSIIKINQREYQKFYIYAQWRQTTQYPIVKLVNCSLQKEIRDACYVNIYVEHQKFSLQDFYQLKFLEVMYILKKCLYALSQLSHMFGFFILSKKMILLNEKQECNIWINENLFEFQRMYECKSEKEMVCSLFQILQNKVQKQVLTKQFFNRQKYKNFEIINAHNYLDEFIYQKKLIIPFFLSIQTQFVNKSIHQFHQRSASLHNNSNKKYSILGDTIKPIFNIEDLKNSNLNNSKKSRKSKMKRVNIRNKMKQSKQTANTGSEEITTNKQLHQFNNIAKRINLGLSFLEGVTDNNKKNKHYDTFSTLQLNISNDHAQNKVKRRYTEDLKKSQQSNKYLQKNRQIFKENIIKNDWKFNLVQILGNIKDIKESITIGNQCEQKNRHNFEQLDQYGKFLSTSLLSLRQESSDYISQSLSEIEQK